MQKVHREIIVKGKVQGVFFRAGTRNAAVELGISGQVKNLPDGSVWIAAEGEEEVMERFISWCRQGPPRARVDEISVKEGTVQGYEEFEVVR